MMDDTFALILYYTADPTWVVDLFKDWQDCIDYIVREKVIGGMCLPLEEVEKLTNAQR